MPQGVTMGYRAEHANYYGLTISDEAESDGDEIDSMTGTPFEILWVGAFDGADSRVDEFKTVLCFRRYSYCSSGVLDNGAVVPLSGDINGVPSPEEIQELRDFCAKHNIEWSEPVREALSYIV